MRTRGNVTHILYTPAMNVQEKNCTKQSKMDIQKP
jgi:hypothetical protein